MQQATITRSDVSSQALAVVVRLPSWDSVPQYIERAGGVEPADSRDSSTGKPPTLVWQFRRVTRVLDVKVFQPKQKALNDREG